MDYKDHKVQCEIKVIYEHFDKTFECVQQLTIKELEDVLNDKEVVIICINSKFINKISKKLMDYYYVDYSEYIKHYGIIKIYFDKYILTMVDVIPTRINELITDGSNPIPGMQMHGRNIIVTENEFVNNSKFMIERTVNKLEVEARGYMLAASNDVKYNIKINTKEEG